MPLASAGSAVTVNSAFTGWRALYLRCSGVGSRHVAQRQRGRRPAISVRRGRLWGGNARNRAIREAEEHVSSGNRLAPGVGDPDTNRSRKQSFVHPSSLIIALFKNLDLRRVLPLAAGSGRHRRRQQTPGKRPTNRERAAAGKQSRWVLRTGLESGASNCAADYMMD